MAHAALSDLLPDFGAGLPRAVPAAAERRHSPQPAVPPLDVEAIVARAVADAEAATEARLTLAHEADLCTELGLRYNSLAIVDNYANGLVGTEIDFTKFKTLVMDNQEKVNRLFARLLEILG